MKAVCALLIAALLPLPAQADDRGMAVSAPAAATGEAAPAPMPAAADNAMAPASAPASAPQQASPASTPAAAPEPAAAASAPGATARKKTSPRSARMRAAPVQDEAGRQRAAAVRKGKTGPGAAQAAADDMGPDRNPVIEAINLVATTQRDEIRSADRKVANADWWLDALDREWIVKRPFGPGLFDTTHWFYVSYKVNGRVLMSWFVDLGKGTVSPTTPPDRQNGQ
jgi:hypothetical protein